MDKEFGAAPRDENPEVHDDPPATEVRPAKNVLQGSTRDTLIHHASKIDRCLSLSVE
jgi:hypothetical protein